MRILLSRHIELLLTFFFLIIRRPTRSTRTDTRCPSTPLFRSFGLGRARRSGRAARPQRRGQDDVLLFGDGAGEARFGPRAARWRGYHRAADVPPRNPGARLSAAGNVDLS